MSLLRREKRPPVEPADWRDVTTLTIGSTERLTTAEGTRVGVIQRLTRKGPRRHTWRIEQPNRSRRPRTSTRPTDTPTGSTGPWPSPSPSSATPRP